MTETTSSATPVETARAIPPSGIREIFNLVLGRTDVLHLEVGEPDFRTPEHIIEAAVESARSGAGYTATCGILPLREAACAHLANVHALDVDPGNVLITQGATHGIATAFAATVTDGDEVLVPDPAWPNYEMLVAATGATLVRYPLRASTGYLPDPGEVRALITDRTKLLVVNSPGNPTGTSLPPSTLEELVNVARSRGVLVLSDEVYDEIVFDGRAPSSAVGFDPDWVIGTWSCSKTYAMTGWRVGYLAAPPSLVTAMTGVQEATIACVSSITQAAALAALSGPQECVAEMRDAYERRRDVLVGIFAGAGLTPVIPGGAFYLMLPLARGADGRRAALALVDEGVAVAPGTAFGNLATNALRISLAASEQTIAKAGDILVAWYERTDGGLNL